MKKNMSKSKIKPTLQINSITKNPSKREFSKKEVVARTTPITDLITARRLLDDASRILSTERNQMQYWDTDMKTAWKNLEEKELELRDTFVRFNHFVQENYEKRERAKQKIEKELESQKKQTHELVEIEQQIADLKVAEEELDKKLKEYEIYRNFLHQVVENSTDLPDIQSILSRYETLSWTRKELDGKQAEALAAIQSSREQLTNKAEKQAQTLMDLHTKLADLRVRHATAQTTAIKWENILARVRTFAAEKAMEIEQVRGACCNLYKTICKLRKEPEIIPDWDTEHQLVDITRRILHLNKVTSMVREKLVKSEPPTNLKAPTSTTGP